MEDRNIGILEQIIFSIISIKSYLQAKGLTMGRAFLYLLVLMVLFGSIDSIRFCYLANEGINEMHASFKKEMPEFKVSGNEFKFYGQMPYTQKSDTDNSIFVIDTTGQTNRSILDQYEKGVFINKTQIVHKKNTIETREYEMSTIYSTFGEITKSTVEELFSFTWIIFIFIFIGYFIYYYIAKLFAALVISLVGLIINAIMSLNEQYGNIFKLSIYSLTLPILLDTAVGFLPVEIPYFWLAYIITGCIYTGLALYAVKNDTVNTV